MRDTIYALTVLFFFAPVFACAQVTNDSLIHTWPAEKPEYPGGIDSLIKEVSARVNYPQQCIDSNIQGKVYVRFVVNEDGTISNLETGKANHPLLGAAAIEAAKGIGKFKPAFDQGRPVKAYYTIPVSFKLTEPYNDVPGDEPPEFPGGDVALIQWIQERIRYPAAEQFLGNEGKVYLRWVVMEDGSVTDIKVVKGVSPGLDKEALRVAGELPKFIPARQAGKRVRVYFDFPVVFSFSKEAPHIINQTGRFSGRNYARTVKNERTPFLGNYYGAEQCASDTGSYILRVLPFTENPKRIVIENIRDPNYRAYATVAGVGFSIDEDQFIDKDLKISGYGIKDDETLTFSYQTFTGDKLVQVCTFTGTSSSWLRK
jgi:TonB family protein